MASGLVRHKHNGQLHPSTAARSLSRYVEYQNISIVWMVSQQSLKMTPLEGACNVMVFLKM